VVRDDDAKFEAEKRAERMRLLEDRIGLTPSGERFLDRIYEIGKPSPLHPEPEDEEGR
jgi:hypothetical protein